MILMIESIEQDARRMDSPAAACIAVAGPVNLNMAKMTNRSWVIDGNQV